MSFTGASIARCAVRWAEIILPLPSFFSATISPSPAFCALRRLNQAAAFRNLENNILSGKYNDGEDWAAAYNVAIDGTSLTLTSVNDAAEVTKYSACSIPEEVIQGSEVVVKSAEAGL